MADLKFPEGTFVVVTTGHEAKTFRVEGGSLKGGEEWTPANLSDDGPAGKSAPDTSPRDRDEATFSKQIAERLYKMAHKNAFSSLILAADPETLGQIRPLLHQEVSKKIVAELAKTLIHSSVKDIEASLAHAESK